MPVNTTVVITRPLAQAEAMAVLARAPGREVVVFPLLEITPLADTTALRAALAMLESYDLITFVSPNAIAAAFAARPDWPPGLSLAVMGEGSRRELARHGMDAHNARIVCPRDPQRTDSQTLLEALDLDQLRGKRVLVLRGESGRELLADALRSAGASVTQIAAYRRSAPAPDPARKAVLAALLEKNTVWLITSSEALRHLVAMVENIAPSVGVAKLQRQQLLVPHQRISDTARLLGFSDVVLTGSGDVALLAALQS